jgi:hypothetical protein
MTYLYAIKNNHHSNADVFPGCAMCIVFIVEMAPNPAPAAALCGGFVLDTVESKAENGWRSTGCVPPQVGLDSANTLIECVTLNPCADRTRSGFGQPLL